MAKYVYQHRSAEDWEKRANQTGGDFQGFIKDGFPVYVVKKGNNAVRFMPPTWTEPKPNHYGIEIWTHFSVGPDKATVLCPQKMRGKPCPLCEAKAKAADAGEQEEADALKPTKRVIAWILDREDRDKEDTPQVWAMPWTFDKDIGKITRDRRTGELFEIDDPEDGYDVYFEKEGEGLRTKYVGHQLARRPSSVSLDAMDYVNENPLPEVLLWRDYDEILDLFQGSEVTANRDDREERSARRREERRGGRDDRGGRDRADDRSDRRSGRDDDRRSARDRDDDGRSSRDDDRRSSRDDERSGRSSREDRRSSHDQDEPDTRRVSRDDDRRSSRREPDGEPERISRRTTSRERENGRDERETRTRTTVRDDRDDRTRSARDDRRSARDDDPPPPDEDSYGGADDRDNGRGSERESRTSAATASRLRDRFEGRR